MSGMNRIIERFYQKELKAREELAYNRGVVAANEAFMEALRRSKVFMFGKGPIAGLNEFMARTPATDVSLIGCYFGTEERPYE